MSAFNYHSPVFWPQVGKVITTSVGTGTLVARNSVLTAYHLVETQPEGQFLLVPKGRLIVRKSGPSEKDIALLEVATTHRDHEPPPFLPVPVAIHPPRMPLEFRSCGYRGAGADEAQMLWATGWIHGRDIQGRFQLETRNQIRPGMSGAPVVVLIGQQTFVIGVIECRVIGDAVENHEGLAFATPLEDLPPPLLDRLAPVDLTDAAANTETVAGPLRREIRKLRRNARIWKALLWISRVAAGILFLGSAGLAWYRMPLQSFALLAAGSGAWGLSAVFRAAWTRTRVSIRAWLQTLAKINGGQFGSAKRLAHEAIRVGVAWK